MMYALIDALQLLLLGVGIVTDLTARRVPNGLVVLLGANGLLLSLTAPPNHLPPLLAVAGGAVGLLLWLPWWLTGTLGAGDVKYFAAGAVALGPALAWRSAVVAALLGGLFSLALLLIHRRRSGGSGRLTVPYAVPMGIALALGLRTPDHLLTWLRLP
jgi:prepilin peptidase CpaA